MIGKDINKITDELKHRVLEGGNITKAEAILLAENADIDALCDAADEICRTFIGNNVDSCSIVNARSGLCSEDCKWCAQASRHHTGCKTYNIVDRDELMHAAEANSREGIKRLSLVTSGKNVQPKDLERFCELYRELAERFPNLYLCASMGLLDYNDMQKLKEAGVKRYHCNLETSESYFSRLCTTHTPQQKKQTLKAAKQAGLRICSGGIIGMGESMTDRIDLAFELAEIDVDSVPINILNPIKGTPLQNTALISEEEIIKTVAIFRFILPKKTLRFAGGRARLNRDTMKRILRGGMNGVLMGDMLTSIGNKVADDRELFREAELYF